MITSYLHLYLFAFRVYFHNIRFLHLSFPLSLFQRFIFGQPLVRRQQAALNKQLRDELERIEMELKEKVVYFNYMFSVCPEDGDVDWFRMWIVIPLCSKHILRPSIKNIDNEKQMKSTN